MHILLFDTAERNSLFPLTATRAVAGIRMGILTMQERWEQLSGLKVFVITEPYLQPLCEQSPQNDEYLLIDARIIPSTELTKKILSLPSATAISDETGLIAGKTFLQAIPAIQNIPALFANSVPISNVPRVTLPQHIFQQNHEMIVFDFYLLTGGKTVTKCDNSIQVVNAANIFISEDATISHCVLNASAGPIYIGKGATVMEGCLIRGPFALCEGAVLKMGTRVYGSTTLGPYCTGGGEIKNSVLFGYSNKGHDGYLGDSVVGEWCNFGAGTSNSNVKNTGGDVALWSYRENGFLNAGNKCGFIMGDYSRTAINTSVNTGTVAGVCCNIFGESLPPKFIPDFSWGAKGNQRYDFEKAVKDIANWKKMKNKTVTETERQVLKHIFETHND